MHFILYSFRCKMYWTEKKILSISRSCFILFYLFYSFIFVFYFRFVGNFFFSFYFRFKRFFLLLFRIFKSFNWIENSSVFIIGNQELKMNRTEKKIIFSGKYNVWLLFRCLLENDQKKISKFNFVLFRLCQASKIWS